MVLICSLLPLLIAPTAQAMVRFSKDSSLSDPDRDLAL